MHVSSRERASPERRPSANERLRMKWRSMVWYGTIASLAGHVLVIALAPAWEWGQRMVVSAREPLRLEWLPPLDPVDEPVGGAEAAAPEPEVAEAEPETGADGEEMGLADLLDVLRDQMPQSFTPVVTRTEEPGDADAEYDAAALDYRSVVGSLPLDLGRLSTVSPELALSTGAPDWPLIRNPNQVVRFIKSGYDRTHLNDAARGLVTVAMWIDRNGSVEWAEVHESSGYADLDEIALEVLSEVAQFRPVRRQGVTGTLALLVSIRFPF